MHAPNNPLWELMLLIAILALLLSAWTQLRRRRVLRGIPGDPLARADWAKRRVMPAGIDGTATVLRFSDLGDAGRGNRRFELDLSVDLPDRPRYELRRQVVAAPGAAGKLQSGMAFPIRVDPAKPDRAILLYGAARSAAEAGPEG